MLRAGFFARTALNAFGGFLFAVACNQPVFLVFGSGQILIQRVIVHCRKAAAYADIHGADLGAVVAGGAGNERNFCQRLLRLFQRCFFGGGKAFKILHVRKVVLHLLNIAHAAEHGNNAFQMCSKADGPACHGHFRLGVF